MIMQRRISPLKRYIPELSQDIMNSIIYILAKSVYFSM
jgi:hypothetical protein